MVSDQTLQQTITLLLIASTFLYLLLLAGNPPQTTVPSTLSPSEYARLVRRGVSAPPLLVHRTTQFSLSQAQEFCDNLPITRQHSTRHYVLLMVISAWGNSVQRHAIRRTWARYPWFRDTPLLSYTYKFVISNPTSEQESASPPGVPDDLEYDDVVMAGHLNEHYYLLDVKVSWGLSQLLQTHMFEYLLKVDDDSFVNLQQLPRKITSSIGSHEFFYGGHRLVTRRWTGEPITYASGSGYVLSRAAVCAVVYAHATYTLATPRIPIEDAYTGLLCQLMGIPLVNLAGFAMEHESCKDFTTVTFHHLDYRVFRKLLNAAINGTHFC